MRPILKREEKNQNETQTQKRASLRRAVIASIEAVEDRTLLSTTIPTVDLLVGYTTKLKNDSGGETQVKQRIYRAVADLNMALTNSGVNEVVRLVGIQEVVGYTESTSTSTELNNLTTRDASGKIVGTDALKPLVAKRATLGADLVELVFSGNVGGRAGQPTEGSTANADNGFGVASLFSAVTPIHEIGHMLGAGHDGSGKARPATVTVAGATYNTVMGGMSVPFFSNPNVSYRWVAMGTPGSADNAGVMNAVSKSVSEYLTSTVTDSTGPLAGLGQVYLTNGQKTIDLKVVYYDDGGVNLASLAATTIHVSGAGGTGEATFQGISAKTAVDPNSKLTIAADTANTSVVIANYKVTLAGTVGDLSGYTFTLGASKGKDQAGNSASTLYVSASGDISSASAPLPTFAGTFNPSSPFGDGVGRATELGDLYGKSFRISDYYASTSTNSVSNSYRFKLSASTTLTPKLTGISSAIVELALVHNDGSYTPIDAVSGKFSDLVAGDYVLLVRPDPFAASASRVPGVFTLTLSAGGTATTSSLPGTLAFSATTAKALRTDAGITLTVDRTGGSHGAVTVQYATSNGTALAGSQYKTTSGTLAFADGQTVATITIPLINDTSFTSGSKTFTIKLSTATGGATLGTAATVTATIDSVTAPPVVTNPGTLAFATSAVTGSSAAGSVTLTISRTGGSTGAVAVHFATADGTATAGKSYTAASGTVSFATGEISKTISISLLSTTNTASTSFIVSLSSPTNGALLGTTKSVTITIPGVTGSTVPSSGTVIRYVEQPTTWREYTITFIGGGYCNYSYRDLSKSTLQPTGASGSGSGFLFSSLGIVLGYAKGAKVFFDANANGVQDAAEVSSYADSQGKVFLLIPPEQFTPKGQYVAIGGTNTATGLATQFAYTAPAGYQVISPLTTLIEDEIRYEGLSGPKAMKKVEQALHLSTRLDLATFDALDQGISRVDPLTGQYVGGNPDGLAAYRADVLINSLVSLTAGFASGVPGSPSLSLIADKVFQRLAHAIHTTNLDLDSALVNPNQVRTLLKTLIPGASVAVTPQVLSAASQVIANYFAVFNEVQSPSGDVPDGAGDPSYFEALTRDERVGESKLEAALKQLGTKTLTPTHILSQFTKAKIAALDAVAPVGDLLPPTVVVEDVTSERLSTDSSLVFNVTLFGDISPLLPTTVYFRTVDGTAAATAGDYLPLAGKLVWNAGDPATKTITVAIPGGQTASAMKQFGVALIGADNGKLAVDHATGTILNRFASSAGKAISVSPGRVTQMSIGTFTDAKLTSSASDFAAIIAWGDGQTTAGKVVRNSDGTYRVVGSHFYPNAGTYQATVTVRDQAVPLAKLKIVSTIKVR